MIKSITRHVLLTITTCIISLLFGIYLWKSTQDVDYVNLSISIYSIFLVLTSSILGIIAILLRQTTQKRSEYQDLFYNFAGAVNLSIGLICMMFMYKTSPDSIFVGIFPLILSIFILGELYIRKLR
jgi:amino acid transporter